MELIVREMTWRRIIYGTEEEATPASSSVVSKKANYL
jgi:hypothetical protein